MPKVPAIAFENPRRKKRTTKKRKGARKVARKTKRKVVRKRAVRKNPGPSRARVSSATKRKGWVIRGYGKNQWWYFTGDRFDSSELKAAVYFSRPGAYAVVKSLRTRLPKPLKSLMVHPA